MSTKFAPYRIEERLTDDAGTFLLQAIDLPGGTSRDEARQRFNQILTKRPLRYRDETRLVLLGPDRTVLPAAITEGPAL